MPFINKPDSSRDLIIFLISFISSLVTIDVVLPDLNIFLWIAASVSDAAAAVNRNGIKTLLPAGLTTLFIKGNTVFSNYSKSLSKNPLDCPILCNWVFDDFILAEELFAKALQSFETFLLVNSNLCGKLFLSLELSITFDESFKVTLVSFFIPDFNLLSCELDSFSFKVLYWVILF